MRYFPLFADLRDRAVLVVGGGVVAERKARLLLAAGAHVTLVAPDISPALVRLAAAPRGEGAVLPQDPDPYAGRLDLRREAFKPAHFDGQVLVIAATDDSRVNEQVASTGRERNVLVNVVDVSELSSFIVPAIVDRSPVLVAMCCHSGEPLNTSAYSWLNCWTVTALATVFQAVSPAVVPGEGSGRHKTRVAC